MERLPTYFLSVVLLSFGCQPNTEWYRKDLTGIDSADYAQKFLKGMISSYYQGTPPAEVMLYEAQKFDTTNAALWREFGVPYLKRGYYHKSYYYYNKAVQHDPATWQGWRGYNYLYFYRDFERAIADFNATDTLTENFTDYPQGQSVDYMRGIAYYGLMDYKNAHRYFDLYVEEVLGNHDESWADPKVFLYKGLAYLSENKNDSAITYFDKVIKYDGSLADGYYHKARALLALNQLAEARVFNHKALTQFKSGSNHKRPYVEVLDQIYIEDIAELMKKIDGKKH
ncbi:MAG: hypothetical protein AAF519_01620 [Bacteroidota bacterium]